MKLNIWLILDGKRGHEKQVEDLVYCINKKNKTNITSIKKIGFLKIILNILRLRYDQCQNFPKPHLIIAAGHQTHFDALQKRAMYGGKLIIIMKPTLPSFFFDLCLIPLHDKVFFKKNIIFTDGPINRIFNKKYQIKNQGLILVGGPSKNYFWSDFEVAKKIADIIIAAPKIKFTLATSRRTPKKFLEIFEKVKKSQIKIIDHESVSKDWLTNTIGKYEFSWVTQDSISMIYELISSGSKVTCISLKSKNKKFEKIFNDLYLSKKINLSEMRIEKINVSQKKESSASLAAKNIIKKFIK